MRGRKRKNRAAPMPARPSTDNMSRPPPPPELGAAVTVKSADAAGDVPAALAHANVYVSVPLAVGFTVCEPLIASAPLQPPDAVQPVAPVEDQVIVVELPTTMEVSASVRVGAAGGAVTANVTALAADAPIELVQSSEYVLMPPAAGVTS